MATLQQQAHQTEQLHRQMMAKDHQTQDMLAKLPIAKHSPLIGQTTQKLLFRIRVLKLFIRLISKFNASERRMWLEKAFSGFSRVVLRRKGSDVDSMKHVAVTRAPRTVSGHTESKRPSVR